MYGFRWWSVKEWMPARVTTLSVGTSQQRSLADNGADGRLLYVHPYSHPEDYIVPAGLVGIMNRVDVPKLGRYSFELCEDEARAARCFALDLHWFFSIDAVAAITADLKALNPDAPIILGGITASFYASYLMKRLPIDYLVQGDAEDTFPRLVECIFENRQVPDMPNLHRRLGGPPRRRIQVSPTRYGNADYLTRDWFPTFAAHTRAAHQRYATRPFRDIDHFHPYLMLNRGCRFGCNFCFGAYQGDVFGPDQVERDVEAFERALDAVVADPELEFVNLMFGTESNSRLDTYRPVLEKHRSVGITLMFCELPRFDQVELLLDAFDRCFIDFTNPAEIPFPLRAAGWSIERANDHLVELAHFLDGRDNCQASISFLSREPSAFRDRLQAARFKTLKVKDNYEWNLPKPNCKTLERGHPPDKTGQAEQLRLTSRGIANFIVARALAPALHPILDQPRTSSHHTDMTLETRDAGLRRFRESYVAAYKERCVATVDAVRARLRYFATEDVPGSATLTLAPTPGADGIDIGFARIRSRFNGVHVDCEAELPAFARSHGGRVVVGLVLGDPASAQALDLFDVSGLPLWTVALPPARGDGPPRFSLRLRLSQASCTIHAHVDGELVLEAEWDFFETQPPCELFGLDLDAPPRETPESVIRDTVSGRFADSRSTRLLEQLMARTADEERLAPWSIALLERQSAWVCWELAHAEVGRIWLFAVPVDSSPVFARGRHVGLVYRALDGADYDHVELRRVLAWLARVVARL